MEQNMNDYENVVNDDKRIRNDLNRKTRLFIEKVVKSNQNRESLICKLGGSQKCQA